MNNYNEKETILMLQDPSTQRKAFERIVKAYSEQLYWQIRRMVVSHDDANDLLQNTFIKAWANLDYFRGDAKLSTWLYRIAFNECLNFLNKQRAENQLSIDDADAALINKLESDPYFNGDETQRLFQKAILQLPTAHHFQPEIFPGNEIRGHVGNLRHQRRRTEGILPSCRQKNRRFFSPT